MRIFRHAMWLPRQFMREVCAFKKQYPDFRAADAIGYFLPWTLSNLFRRTPLSDERPWITFSAIAYLSSFLQPRMNVFEYGSGGSTVYLVRRGAKLHTVEHDPRWLEAVTATISEVTGACWFPCLREPEINSRGAPCDPEDPSFYCSGSDSHHGHTFRAYVQEICRFPDGYFDIILIDGRARPSCLVSARSKVKIGGLIVMDNTDRTHYRKAMNMLTEGFRFLDFPGPSPYVTFFTRTSAWRRQEV